MRFLHISDVHLGCTRYNLPESPRDFFDAWIDVLQRYGVDESVDFDVVADRLRVMVAEVSAPSADVESTRTGTLNCWLNFDQSTEKTPTWATSRLSDSPSAASAS